MSKELPKAYEPQEVEGRIYEMWERSGCFKAYRDPDKKAFTIAMPSGSGHIIQMIEKLEPAE